MKLMLIGRIRILHLLTHSGLILIMVIVLISPLKTFQDQGLAMNRTHDFVHLTKRVCGSSEPELGAL